MSARTVGRGGAMLMTLSAIVLVGLPLFAPSAAVATYPGGNGRIAYVGPPASMARDNDIFSVRANGLGPRQLTDNSFDEGDPSWSADGKRLAYIRAVPGRYQVFKMSADGKNQTQVTHDNGIDATPGFSPSGHRIIYSKDNLPTAGSHNPRRVSIFTIRPDGTKKRVLVHGGYAVSPEYSPNGKRIVFAGHPDRSHTNGIWTIRSNGSHPRRLTDPGRSDSYDAAPDWSPDGHHVVFVRCAHGSSEGCQGHVHTMRPNGSHQHPLLGANGVAPVYSPAGNRIALAIGAQGCGDIYTLARAGSDPRAVTHFCDDPSSGLYATMPTWQPVPGD
jgi:Tol biopolymer transport system component